MIVPNQVNNFAIFLNSTMFLGLADIQLPDITFEKDDLKGAGIAGTIAFPVIGQTADMTTTLNFHTLVDTAIPLLYQVGQQIDARAALQQYDSSSNDLNIIPERIVMQTLPTKFNLGKFEPGTKSEVSVELVVTALSVYYNNVVRVNIDKINMIFNIDGTDYLQSVRQAIGF